MIRCTAVYGDTDLRCRLESHDDKDRHSHGMLRWPGAKNRNEPPTGIPTVQFQRCVRCAALHETGRSFCGRCSEMFALFMVGVVCEECSQTVWHLDDQRCDGCAGAAHV